MKKLALTAAAALLVAPALAQAKAGVEFQGYPDTAKPGQKIDFTVIAGREPPGGGADGASPIVGREPLVTFRSESGRVVRVRASRTDRNGMAYGQVAFPDKGPWTTELKVGNALHVGAERSEPFRIGVGLTQTIPAADASRQSAPHADGGFPWVWVLSLASIGSALLVFAMRRHGRWGAA